LTFSPITGGEGNIEFLAYWTLDKPILDDTVDQSTLEKLSLATHWHKKINEIVIDATSTFKSPGKP
jgi:hypothetical protein